jgi:hypothetical protein
MPLLDLKTDLKSIRFGSPDAPGDRPGGGWSNQPYITSKIPDNTFQNPASEDFLLRGGLNAITDSAEDIVRLSKFFFDPKSPSGLIFTAKQQLLSRTAVKLQAGSIGSGIDSLRSITKSLLKGGLPALSEISANARNAANPLNAGVYNPLNTIAQAGVNAIGGHLNKQGIDGSGLTALSLITYSDLVTRTQPDDLNRLIQLKNGVFKDAGAVNLFSYPGGPGSNLGVGNTDIRFASPDQRTGDANILRKNNPTLFYGRGGGAYTTKLLENRETSDSFRNSNKIQDFRKPIGFSGDLTPAQYIIARNNGTLTNAPDYTTKNFETRVNAGNPGDVNLKRNNYSSGATNPVTGKVNVVNKINALYMYKSNNVTTDTDKVNDFVKFRFAVINPDKPKQKTFVHFPAFFDGAITDNISAGWNAFKYLGRGEEFFNYEGFNRDVGFSFQVVAQSRPELSIMYQKLNYLQSTLAPNFSTNGFMRGNIHQLTIGGYFYEQPGVITSLNYTMPSESPWEIGISSDGSYDNGVKELTHIINVSVGFKPIQNFLPQTIGSPFDTTNKDGIFGKNNIKQRFSQLANGTKTNQNLYTGGFAASDTVKTTPLPEPPSLGIQEIEFDSSGIEDEDEEFTNEDSFFDINAASRAGRSILGG